MQSILIVDDDITLCGLLQEFLQTQGFSVTVVHKGEEGLAHALSGEYALVVLDRTMPDVSGFKVLRLLRSRSKVPVVIISARGDEMERIRGLELGADDYLPKPFNPRELSARIRGIFRRIEPEPAQKSALPAKSAVDDIEIDRSVRMAFRQGRPIKLTACEFEILELLLSAPGRVVSRDEIALGALGRPIGLYDRSADVHISNLRRKLGPHFGGADRIRTVRGLGYLYAPLHPQKSS
ncbi:MAG: response regulator transcription factor [Syntrophobacteraceae bacterium]|jgi:two-component system response regulator CpxR